MRRCDSFGVDELCRGRRRLGFAARPHRARRRQPGGRPGRSASGTGRVIPLLKAAVFDIQLVSLGAAPTDADKARLPSLSAALRDELVPQNLFDVVAIAPDLKAEVDKQASLRTGNSCAVDYAKRLGAQVAVTADLKRSRPPPPNLNVFIKLVSGGPKQNYTANVSGDDDRSLDHAVK